MNFVSRELLNELCATRSDSISLVSAYIPMHRFGHEINQTTFRNVLRSLRAKIPTIEGFSSYSELQRLSDDPIFWTKQKQGICFFMTPERLIQMHLPFEPPFFHTASDRFFVAPLILYQYMAKPFYVVAFSQKGVRVLDANLFEVVERDIPTLTQSLFERLEIDEVGKTVQAHTSGREGLAGRGASQLMFHGQGNAAEKLHDTLLEKYVRSIGEELKAHFEDQRRKIIYVGTGNHFALFKEYAGFSSRVVSDFIEGHFDLNRNPELYERLHELIRELLLREVRALDAAADERRGTSIFEVKDPKVVESARYGEIDMLFVNVGRFNNQFKAPSREYLSYEMALREVWLRGGKIIPNFDSKAQPLKATRRFDRSGDLSWPAAFT